MACRQSCATLRRLPVLLGVWLLMLSTQVAGAEQLRSLTYGVTLYHYYQGHYFDALTELMAAQETMTLAEHREDAEILRGGMTLSYGMPDHAQRIFEDLLTEQEAGANAQRAWFYLARMHFQQGNYPLAAQLLTRAPKLLQYELAQERQYMLAAAALFGGQYDTAEQLAQGLAKDSGWDDYYAYNLGAGQAAAGDWTQAVTSFDRIKLRGSEDSKALADRARTAAGFALMAIGDHAAATEQFQRVRRDSAQSQRALLGLGWAASVEQDYQVALAPWSELAQQRPLNDSVAEALLAEPFAWQQLAHEKQALELYQQAVSEFAVEQERLEALRQSLRSRPMQELLASWTADSTTPLSGSIAGLPQLASSNQFQRNLTEWQDLRDMESRLLGASQRLQVLVQVDSEQQASWQSMLDNDAESSLRQRQQSLRARAQLLSVQLQAAADSRDGRMLADAAQQELWLRLQNAQLLTGGLVEGAPDRARVELLEGLMVWSDSEQYHTRFRDHERQLTQLQGLLRDSELGLQSLQETIARRRSANYSSELAEQQARVERNLGRLGDLWQASENGLRQQLMAAVAEQEQFLARASSQSRLAIARLYDPLVQRQQASAAELRP